MFKNNRIIAIVMSLIMAISMLPAMAFAADSSTPQHLLLRSMVRTLLPLKSLLDKQK